MATDTEEMVVQVMKRAEIDTRAPFRSVKEAVMLFGERVLAGELYSKHLKEMGEGEMGHGQSKLGTVTTELEETKQSLQQAREEGVMMANCLSSLSEELEKTKIELKQMKAKEAQKQPIYSEMEDLKFVENARTIKVETPRVKEEEGVPEVQNRRYVKFASPPSLAQVVSPAEGRGEVLERQPSLRTKKKKNPIIPLIGFIFSKKRGTHQGGTTTLRVPPRPS
ncbi:WEB family protein At1g75720-like [Macadamia integrifolia]|uniref:WEB family protein At1g75720-like n=1 Tax=Macadamia integrifolia TaxID=60698 RepID=UPI001C4F7797|nr:WEB family protein At1g75720-like [Macadamia integrifolia]